MSDVAEYHNKIEWKQHPCLMRQQLLYAILVGVLLLFNGDTLISAYPYLPIRPALILPGISLLFFGVYMTKRTSVIQVRPFLGFCILVSSVLLNMLINGDFRNGYIVIISGFACGFMLIHLIPVKDFAEWTTRWMVFLALYSLAITYIFKPMISGMSTLFPQFRNIADLPLINAWLGYVVNIPGYYRNFGIFREGGVYQIFLNLSLMFEMFVNRRPRLLRIIILLVTIISTFSTAGYVVALILICANLVRSRVMPRSERAFWIVSCFVMLASLISLYQASMVFREQFNQAWGKLFMQQSSFHGRTKSILVSLKVWLERPLLGYGITNGFARIVSLLSEDAFGTIHDTSTAGSMLAILGFVPGAIITGMLYSFCRMVTRSGYWLVFLALILAINSQLLIYNEYFYLMIFFSLASQKQRNYSLEENLATQYQAR